VGQVIQVRVFAVPVYGLLMITDDFGCCEKSLIMPLSRPGFPPRRDFFCVGRQADAMQKESPGARKQIRRGFPARDGALKASAS